MNGSVFEDERSDFKVCQTLEQKLSLISKFHSGQATCQPCFQSTIFSSLLHEDMRALTRPLPCFTSRLVEKCGWLHIRLEKSSVSVCLVHALPELRRLRQNRHEKQLKIPFYKISNVSYKLVWLTHSNIRNLQTPALWVASCSYSTFPCFPLWRLFWRSSSSIRELCASGCVRS